MSEGKGLFGRLGKLLGHPDAAPQAPVIPPVDLNVPVTNPALVAAILTHQQARQNETAAALFDALKQSNLLAAIALANSPTPTSPGQALFKKGERIGVVEISDDSNARLLALFTDHAEIARFTSQSNSTLVMPAKQAFSFVLDHGYAGLVVNPASEATLRLDAPFIARIMGEP